MTCRNPTRATFEIGTPLTRRVWGLEVPLERGLHVTASPESPTVIRARVAGLSRDRAPDDPELVANRRALMEATLTRHVRKVVDGWPKLTDEQIDRIVGLLRAGR